MYTVHCTGLSFSMCSYSNCCKQVYHHYNWSRYRYFFSNNFFTSWTFWQEQDCLGILPIMNFRRSIKNIFYILSILTFRRREAVVFYKPTLYVYVLILFWNYPLIRPYCFCLTKRYNTVPLMNASCINNQSSKHYTALHAYLVVYKYSAYTIYI